VLLAQWLSDRETLSGVSWSARTSLCHEQKQAECSRLDERLVTDCSSQPWNFQWGHAGRAHARLALTSLL